MFLHPLAVAHDHLLLLGLHPDPVWRVQPGAQHYVRLLLPRSVGHRRMLAKAHRRVEANVRLPNLLGAVQESNELRGRRAYAGGNSMQHGPSNRTAGAS